MNIMISIDSNYILPAKIMVKSLSLNTRDTIDLFLLYSRLNNEQIVDLSNFCSENCNVTLYPVFVGEELFEDVPLTDRFPVEACSRLMAPFILPEYIERILWLDADIIVKKDMTELYWKDMDTVSIGVVKDQGSDIVISECCERLHLKNDSIYFNSGVILFNLKEIRKRWSKKELFELMRNIQCRLEYPDQDILNLMFEKDKVIFSDAWNYQIKSWSKFREDDLASASIIHYVGPIKPWSSRWENKAKWIWWSYYCICFSKRKFYMFCIKNTWEIFYTKYLEKKLVFVKKLIRSFLYNTNLGNFEKGG